MRGAAPKYFKIFLVNLFVNVIVYGQFNSIHNEFIYSVFSNCARRRRTLGALLSRRQKRPHRPKTAAFGKPNRNARRGFRSVLLRVPGGVAQRVFPAAPRRDPRSRDDGTRDPWRAHSFP